MIGRSVINVKSIDDLIEKLEELISFYEEEFDFKNIRNTKIGNWLKKINNNDLSDLDKLNEYFNINSYVRVLEVFKKYPEVIKKDNIKKILSGGSGTLTDDSGNYFFEMDSARRFILREDFKDIDLKENTDIIFRSSEIKDGNIFIECKNIRKEQSFENNIRKANNQLKEALDSNKDTPNSLGIIFLNLSEIIDKNKYLQLLVPIIEEFLSGYNICGWSNEEIFKDNNFRTIAHYLLQNILELKFWSLFKELEKYNCEFHSSIKGIFYQAELLIPFEDTHIDIRVATFLPMHCDEELARFLFLPLASGI